MAADRQFAFGLFRFDARTGQLWRDGSEVKLTPRAAAVLNLLAERAEDLVTKQELFDRVWGGMAVSDDALTSCIQELRGALGDDARRPRTIETRHRRGYRLMVPATPIAGLHGMALAPPQIATEPTRQDDAERRQLTIMFCDLVGSASLASRLDPEDMSDLIRAFQGSIAAAVARFDGHVAKLMGDGALIYFGYPRAHEDDAERAVRAGLGLAEIVQALGSKRGVALEIRVGIATGLVVVGELMGEGEARKRAVVGETPYLAARLQRLAEPNTVVIADSTRRLLGNLFDLQDLGAPDLKGIAGPVRVWAALRAASVESRFEAMHASGLTALVGREEESELLLRRWSRAKTGEGQVVLLSGEAGIGKSRLTAALLERLAAEPHIRLRYFCSPQHTDSALYPIIGQMERAAGLTVDDGPQAKLDKLDAVLAQTSTSAQQAALFADMLSLPNDGRYPVLDLAPQERRQRTLQSLISQVERLARRNPVLMIFEDAHWTDPTSLEVLGRAVDRIATLRVLLIVTFRPEFDPPWIGRPHVTALTINRLTQGEVGAMIDRVVGNKLIPAALRRDIVERTDGIPLFVEEMTKAVLEADSEGEARRTVAAVPSPALAVPASLHASLMARLDRLGPAKEVAQIGAAIGREFSHALLAAVARKPAAELGSALDRLVASGLLFRQGVPPHATYLFKHALVQDAAYGTLLRAPRRALHARIATALESQFAEIAESEPEVLAHHFTQAGLTDAAIEWWGKAGEQALRRSAFQEAISHLGKAIEMADKTGESRSAAATAPASASQRLKLQTDLGKALMWSRGFSGDESKAAFIRARELAAAIDNPTERFTIYYGLWVGNLARGELGFAREIAETFLREAERGALTTECGAGRFILGHTCLRQGDFIEARANLVEALSIYDPERDREARFRFGPDIGASARAHLAHTKWQLGEVGPARALIEEAVAVAIETGHVPTLVNTYFYKAHFETVRSNAGAARRDAEVVVKLSQENALTFYAALGALQSAWASARLDGRESGATELRQALAAYTNQGYKLFVPFFQGLLAEIEAQGDAEGALTRIDEALALAGETGEHWSDAFLHRLRGEILLKRDPANTAPAEEAFLTAIAVAQQQKARSFELRAALALAKLYQSTGRVADAHAVLASALQGFSATPEFPEIAEGQTLLSALTS